MGPIETEHNRQARAVVREWREAEDAGNNALADRIQQANPDLFDYDGQPLWQYVAD